MPLHCSEVLIMMRQFCNDIAVVAVTVMLISVVVMCVQHLMKDFHHLLRFHLHPLKRNANGCSY